jgi:hypothetical protein
MSVSFDTMLKELFTPAERAAIRRTGKAIARRHLTLAELRRAQSRTQEGMAKRLKVRQVSVSRLEQRNDLLVSTLGRYVRAMGGSLHLVVEFPDQDPVLLAGMGETPRRATATKRGSRRSAG